MTGTLGVAMSVLVLLTAAALLLGFAGVTKLRAPYAAHRAARAVGLPSSPGAIRALSVVEVLVAVGALVSDLSVVRAAVAALYAAFFVFVLVALWRRVPLSSCGCFGTEDASPSAGHAAIDAAAAAAALVAAVDGLASPLDTALDSALDAIVVLGGGALLAVAAGLHLAGRIPRPATTVRR